MPTSLRLAVIVFLCAGLMRAQEVYATHKCVTSRSSVTTEKVTLQGVTSTPISAQLVKWVVLSTVAGTVKFERSGTAATTTAGTVTPASPGGSASRMACYSNSNVGTGTTISVTYPLVANTEKVFDMRDVKFFADSTAANVTAVITLDSTGDVQNQIGHREGRP